MMSDLFARSYLPRVFEKLNTIHKSWKKESPANEVPLGNEFFAGIKFREFHEFWMISRKLFSVKIISKLPIREIRKFNSQKNFKFLNRANQVSG